ncbi:anti-sigma factor [Salipiger pacificus]|nr:anti-sigma factor [Alloyangia pacifica]MCA0943679.1 anti-sigma factor [Alloyangia pacifica]
MSGPPQPDPPEGVEALAAEYVLGLLTEPELRHFEALLVRDAGLRQEVASWQACFAALTADIPEAAPPEDLWPRIEARLHGPVRAALWRQLLPYLLGAVAAAGIAWAALVSGVLTPGSAGPELQARLVAAAQGIALRADYAPRGHSLTVTRESGDVPVDRALELWLLSDSAGAPISLGVLGGEAVTSLALAPALRAQLPGATLAISEEPPGGSATGRPSGPVIALGQLAPL